MHCANCRAALAPGSRFCNACGAAVAAPPAPGMERTAQFPRPPAAGQPPAGMPPSGMPPRPGMPPPPGMPSQAGMAPTYQVPSQTPYPGTPEAMPAKKPVALLAAVLALVATGVVAGSLFLMKKSNTAVTAGQVAAVPEAPGLQQAPTQALPQGPGVVTAPSRPQVPGQPVTSAPQRPKEDGMAPNVMMAPGSQAPTAPSVTQAPSVQAPTAPAVTAAPPQPQTPAAPVTRAPSVRPAAPAPAPVVDNRQFDRYIQWLQFVEDKRQEFRNVAAGDLPNFVSRIYDIGINSENPERDLEIMVNQYNRNILVSTRMFQNSLRKSRVDWRLTVPPDCQELDRNYMEAVTLEAESTGMIMQSLGEAMRLKNIGMAKTTGERFKRMVYPRLKAANRELDRVYKARGYDPDANIHIDDKPLMGDSNNSLGGMGSMLGILGGGL